LIVTLVDLEELSPSPAASRAWHDGILDMACVLYKAFYSSTHLCTIPRAFAHNMPRDRDDPPRPDPCLAFCRIDWSI